MRTIVIWLSIFLIMQQYAFSESIQEENAQPCIELTEDNENEEVLYQEVEDRDEFGLNELSDEFLQPEPPLSPVMLFLVRMGTIALYYYVETEKIVLKAVDKTLRIFCDK